MSVGLMPERYPQENAEARLAWRRILRKEGIERRLALSDEDCARDSARIRAHLGEHFPQLAKLRVAFCWPVKNEPDLRPLLAHWLASGNPGFAALLPVVVDAGTALAFRPWSPGCPMRDDRYGIPTPLAGDFQVPEAILIPVNVFDGDGYRIGYGGGFFDRTLAALKPAPLTIGVGFELARVASIHPETYDIRMDAMVSEAGVFHHAPAHAA